MLLALAMLWAYGPLLSINGWQPLVTPSSRYLLGGLIVLLWIVRGWRRWQLARSVNHRIIEQLKRRADQSAARRQAEPPGAGSDIANHFAAALAVLRKTSRDRGRGRWQRLLDRLSYQDHYRLPWFLLVGAAGVGKTSLLAHAGVERPLALPSAGRASASGGSTESFEWWYGNQAVLIDTPSQASAAGQLAMDAAWREFLAQLRRHRPRQPLNGVLLTVSLAELVALEEGERVSYAAQLRGHLLALQADLRMRVPLYVVFSQIDRLQGFAEYFQWLDGDARDQFWGCALGDAPHDTQGFAELFRQRFQSLTDRLQLGLCDVLEREPALEARASACLFPQQFAALEACLSDFLQQLLALSAFGFELWPRGVFFASAKQDGMRRIDLVSDREVPGLTPVDTHSTTTRHAFFLRRLFKDVIFAESWLVGTHSAWRRRQNLQRAAAWGVSGLLLILLLAAWGLSYRHNRDYLHEVDNRVERFQRAMPARVSLPEGDVLTLMPLLKALRHLPESQYFDVNDPPLGYRFGLYQGWKSIASSKAIYHRALDEELLPQAAARVHAILEAASGQDGEYAYQALKAYLMLYDKRHYDGDFLSAWLSWNIERSAPGTATRGELARFKTEIGNLFQRHPVNSPFPFDAALVERVRLRLAQDSLTQRTYRRLRTRLMKSIRLEPVTLISAGGPQASLVFRRKSGRPLSEGVPGLYTYRGYWDFFAKQVASATAAMERDDAWVLNIQQAQRRNDLNGSGLTREVMRDYFNDYVATWESYLNDITLNESRTLSQSMQMARVLSMPDSPLKQFLQAVARETQLLRDKDNRDGHSMLGRAQQRISEVEHSFTDIFGQPSPNEGGDGDEAHLESIVDDHFEVLRRMVEGSGPDGGGASVLDGSLKLVDGLYDYLSAVNTALASGLPAPPPSDAINQLQSEAGRMPMPLRQMFTDLSQTGSTQISSATRHELVDDASVTVGRLCRQTIAGRYPFASGSSRDVSLDDFARMFASHGVMDDFFQNHLAPTVDFSTHPWSFKPDANGRRSDNGKMLAAFENAEIIRDAFFRGGDPRPSISVQLTPLELDPAITQYQLDIDGQKIRYAHGPQNPVMVTWPGPQGGNLVRLQIDQPGGGTKIQTDGAWALHRLFQRAQIIPGDAPENFVARFSIGGHLLSMKITANSAFNPFHLPQLVAFTCP